MNRSTRRLLAIAIAGAFTVLSGPLVFAQDTAGKPAAKSEPIYGYQMMTPQERDEYRAKMRNAASAAERQAVRDEHHAAMAERAKERGLTLPDRPTAAGPRGPGMGPGMGSGAGPRGPGMAPGMGPGGAGPRGPGAGPAEGYGPRGPGSGPRGPGYGSGAAQQ